MWGGVPACVVANNIIICYNRIMQSPDIYTTLLDDLEANRNGSPEVLPLNAPVEQETGDLLVGVNPKEYGKRGVTFTINAGRISIAAADGETWNVTVRHPVMTEDGSGAMQDDRVFSEGIAEVQLNQAPETNEYGWRK